MFNDAIKVIQAETKAYCSTYYAKLWIKGEHSRMYVNKSAGRSIGYIDLNTMTAVGTNGRTQYEIDDILRNAKIELEKQATCKAVEQVVAELPTV